MTPAFDEWQRRINAFSSDDCAFAEWIDSECQFQEMFMRAFAMYAQRGRAATCQYNPDWGVTDDMLELLPFKELTR